ncbi:hypothetical protein D8674_017659 [Pyrus ussuriensis x Pyrus communis]|uniref:Uncharacterized protein n=1 Tax=Pyrus ussuriensis x Pyrus communis TaxID=2448454 RepID=A0A5N5HDB9_9ROSA|nr:hypothetical protein D8674_017659 [Pyrus ussuriensis x Pyrus communis]
MAHNLPLAATFSFPRRSISMLKLPIWANLFPLPNHEKAPIVVQSDNYKFIMERGVTRVDINIISTINVEHMKTRLLMGKMFEKPKKGKVIHRELALSWTEDMEDDLIFCFTQSRIIKGDGARDESKVRLEDDDMTLIDFIEASPRKKKKTFVR